MSLQIQNSSGFQFNGFQFNCVFSLKLLVPFASSTETGELHLPDIAHVVKN